MNVLLMVSPRVVTIMYMEYTYLCVYIPDTRQTVIDSLGLLWRGFNKKIKISAQVRYVSAHDTAVAKA